MKPSVVRAAVIGIVVGIGLTLVGLIPFVGFVTICVAWLVPIGVGALAAYFALQTGPLQVSQGAVDGAIAAAIAGLVNGIVGLAIALLGLGAQTAIGGASPEGTAAGLAIGLGAGIVGLIIGLVIAAVLGAVGGAVYVAIRGQKTA